MGSIITPKGFEQISGTGGFLLTNPAKPNVMTIGWGFSGIMWGEEVFLTVVRHSRFTHELLEKDGAFTVSIPALGQFKRELGFCGTKSGRDTDKLAELGLELMPPRAGKIGGINGCEMHIECEVLHVSECQIEGMPSGIASRYYAKGDPHTIFYGKILAAY